MALRTAEQRQSRTLAIAAASLLALAAVLAGCNLQQRQPAPPQVAPKLDSSSHDSSRGFFFNQDGPNASLAYGRPKSDDVVLMLQCDKGSGMVQIMDVVHEAQPKGAQTLTLISGAAASDLKAQVSLDETGQTLASSQAPTTLGAFNGFRKNGAISVKLGGRVFALTATPGELISVAKFFAACERK